MLRLPPDITDELNCGVSGKAVLNAALILAPQGVPLLIWLWIFAKLIASLSERVCGVSTVVIFEMCGYFNILCFTQNVKKHFNFIYFS
jgi:hypothetical protein